MERTFALQGNIIFTPACGRLEVRPGQYLVCEDGRVAGICETLVDLHVHASQYAYRGLGMDMELLDWLEENAFPEEARFAEQEYAAAAYRVFTDELTRSATTRACVFATVHRPATLLLMELMEKAGLRGFVGKLNMDSNCPDYLWETTDSSLAETRRWLEESAGFSAVRPVITPRFIPSCSEELMNGLGELQRQFGAAMQSHLSENLSEIEWVKQLRPWALFYGEAYSRPCLFGGECPTVMAHCIWSGEEERALMKEQGVFLAHCPQSNMNVSSGIAPVRTWLNEGQKAGLGSDVAGGAHLSIFRAMTDAIQCSKLRWRLVDDSLAALTLPETLYLATKGGGEFFGKVGSFEPGYEFDAIVMDDSTLPTTRRCTLTERLERVIWLSDGLPLAKYVAGRRLF